MLLKSTKKLSRTISHWLKKLRNNRSLRILIKPKTRMLLWSRLPKMLKSKVTNKLSLNWTLKTKLKIKLIRKKAIKLSHRILLNKPQEMRRRQSKKSLRLAASVLVHHLWTIKLMK